jgi:hypothetical protein
MAFFAALDYFNLNESQACMRVCGASAALGVSEKSAKDGTRCVKSACWSGRWDFQNCSTFFLKGQADF